MKLTINVKDDVVCKDLTKLLKEKYNLKLVAIFRYLVYHPEIIDIINEGIDEYDTTSRFQKYFDQKKGEN